MMRSACAPKLTQRIFDDGFQGVGDGLRFGRMAEEREGLSQQPLLKKRDGQRIWTLYRTPISSKCFGGGITSRWGSNALRTS